jgi:glucokinase
MILASERTTQQRGAARREAFEMKKLALVGDIGGTNSRFGLVEPGSQTVQHVEALKNDSFASLEAAIEEYLSNRGVTSLDSAAIAVAAPVDREHITLTNRDWTFSVESLRKAARAKSLRLLNDYEALALALPHFGPEDLTLVGGTPNGERAVKIVLGPGTGLGMAALAPLPGGQGWLPIACEPGHTSLPVETQEEFDWREKMKAFVEHNFTAEDAITGGGLYLMYRVIAADGKLSTPEQVIQAALAGSDAAAARTVNQFIVWLARVAGDAAMELQARGGVYLAGGIAPSITGLLSAGPFRRIFEDKGKIADIMRPIPVYVIIDRFPAFKGCAAALSK